MPESPIRNQIKNQWATNRKNRSLSENNVNDLETDPRDLHEYYSYVKSNFWLRQRFFFLILIFNYIFLNKFSVLYPLVLKLNILRKLALSHVGVSKTVLLSTSVVTEFDE